MVTYFFLFYFLITTHRCAFTALVIIVNDRLNSCHKIYFAINNLLFTMAIALNLIMEINYSWSSSFWSENKKEKIKIQYGTVAKKKFLSFVRHQKLFINLLSKFNLISYGINYKKNVMSLEIF